MRIIAGEKRGMRLVAPKGDATRPTLGKVRESLFMVLSTQVERWGRALDLFAGAGSLGLEALSRGAEQVVFVENSESALTALKANVAKYGCEERCIIIHADAFRFLSRPSDEQKHFDLVLLDPPYGIGAAHESLKILSEKSSQWLTPNALVVAQVGKRDELHQTYGPLERSFERAYGETRIEFFTFALSEEPR